MSGVDRGIVWKSAGIHLVERQTNGWLKITDNYIRAYLTRPEVHPVQESCEVEHRLFERLMADPLDAVSADEIAKIRDPDAVENYKLVLGFRDHLVKYGTVEAAYATLFTEKNVSIPPVFIDQMVHLILAGILRREPDPFVVKAAELLFREQKATTEEDQLMLADSEVVEMMSETGGLGGLGSLLMESGTPMREVTMDILTEDNADQYWSRADRFDFALDFRFTQAGPDALGRVLEKWIRHFHGVDVRIQAMQSIRDEHWSWHVGLDAEATRILNGLYQGKPLSDSDLNRMAALYRVEFAERTDLIETMRGKPVYLGAALDKMNTLKVKPQNLLTGLPLRRSA